MKLLVDRAELIREQFMALPHPARALVAAVLSGTAIVVLVVLLWLASWWAESVQQVETLEPRVAQILGFLESEEQVQAALSRRDAMLSEAVFPDSGDSGRGGAVFQERVRNLSAEAGLTVIGSEVLESEPRDDIIKLRLGTKVAGPPGALVEFFRRITEARPFLFVSAVEVNAQRQLPRRARGPEQSGEANLMAEITLHAYQMAPRQ